MKKPSLCSLCKLCELCGKKNHNLHPPDKTHLSTIPFLQFFLPIFATEFNNTQRMSLNNGTRLIILLSLSLLMLSSCSSSRKVKKKCRECPEFSQAAKVSTPVLRLNEKI